MIELRPAIRWLLAILVLLNVIVFVWFSSQAPDTSEATVATYKSNAPQLMLLAERNASDAEMASICQVVGPIYELSIMESLSARLSKSDVPHQRWSEAAVAEDDALALWLQFPAAEEAGLGRKFWFDILSKSPDTEISQKTCAVVASSTDLP